MIKVSDIKTLEHVKNILDNLKPYDKYIRDNKLEENSYEYESICEKVQIYLNVIEDALIGKQEYNMSNLASLDCRLYEYWKYMGDKIVWKTLVKRLKEYSDGLLLK